MYRYARLFLKFSQPRLQKCLAYNGSITISLLSQQISTSVLRIPVLVTKMLIVPTVTVLTAVLVNKDSLVMAHLVAVCDILSYFSQIRLYSLYIGKSPNEYSCSRPCYI